MSTHASMSTQAIKPTLVFVPGAWHPPTYYQPIMTSLNQLGYPTTTLQNPSLVVSTTEPLRGLLDDIANIRTVLDKLIDNEAKDVVLVVHSYGGMPGAASVPGFEKKEREQQGKQGGIVAVLFIAAFGLPKGTSLKEAVGGTYPPWQKQDGPISTPNNPAYQFYNDVPPSVAEPYIQLLAPQSLLAFETDMPTDCFNGVVPCTYLTCANDNCIALPVQELFIKNIGEGCKVERCDAGHSPFLSQPDLVVRVIRKVAGEEV